MRGFSQWYISGQWANRTISGMLLKCEHLHDLDLVLITSAGMSSYAAKLSMLVLYVFLQVMFCFNENA